jgi:hypothetical protein
MLEPGDLTAEIFDLAAASGTQPVLHIGGPDALGPFAGEPLQALAYRAARERGVPVTLDVLRVGDASTFDP